MPDKKWSNWETEMAYSYWGYDIGDIRDKHEDVIDEVSVESLIRSNIEHGTEYGLFIDDLIERVADNVNYRELALQYLEDEKWKDTNNEPH